MDLNSAGLLFESKCSTGRGRRITTVRTKTLIRQVGAVSAGSRKSTNIHVKGEATLPVSVAFGVVLVKCSRVATVSPERDPKSADVRRIY